MPKIIPPSKSSEYSINTIERKILDSCKDLPLYDTYVAMKQEDRAGINSAVLSLAKKCSTMGVRTAFEAVSQLALYLSGDTFMCLCDACENVKHARKDKSMPLFEALARIHIDIAEK